MSELIFESHIKKSQKDYVCDACNYILEGDSFKNFVKQHKFTFGELRSLVKAKQNGYKILKGQPYYRQFNKIDGDTCTWRVIPEIDNILIKYNLYEFNY